jgi:cellulose synthase operon protein C
MIVVAALMPTAAASSVARASDPEAKSGLPEARHLFLTGKYAEAEELYTKELSAHSVEAGIGIARCQFAVGKFEEATTTLKAAEQSDPKTAAPHAELALVALARGEHDAAQHSADEALKLDENNVTAHWVLAEWNRLAGRLKEANTGYKWLVDFYNRTDKIADPDVLRLIGRGAAQYARWNRLSDQFKFLVNDFYPDLIELDKEYWPAHLDAGLLYLEKFNPADAAKEFHKAAAINPNAAEVHAALAALAIQNYDLAEAQLEIDRAIEINPQLLWAHQLQADVHLANFDSAKAIETLEAALKLNPISEETLGRMAAAVIGQQGLPADLTPQQLLGLSETESHGVTPRLCKLIDEVKERNPHAGAFYEAAGDALDLLRRYPAAATFYQAAIEQMPQLVGPRGKLGMIEMRLGDEAAAEKVLKESFDIDPFNVRVSNTLKVLDVLSGYATLETEHFIIKFDRGQDEILARYLSRFLEDDVYPSLCRTLGYTPKGKTLFEIFSRAKNTDGHGWFSARMVGLPYVGTVGACAGRMIAMQSPNDGKQKFNWARVVQHEFVHVVNLQQTNFNIPHWFTEALAVHNEGYPRPPAWDDLLAQRMKADQLFDLESINTGFIRPKSSAEWTLAYCQALLYAEYMLSRFGDDALAKMLTAYADNLPTGEALSRSFNVSQEEFERGYRDYLKKLIAAMPSRPVEETTELADLEAAHQKQPADNEVAARLALASLRQDKAVQARTLADAVLQREPKHQLATYVLARLKLKAGESRAVLEMLAAALDREHPQPNLLALLAGLKLKAESFEDAASLYQLGVDRFPGDSQWLQSLAQALLKSGDDAELSGVLAKLAARDPDDATIRKKLAQLAIKGNDFAAAERWSREALRIDVMDAGIHRTLAEALVGQEHPAAAVEEYEFAVRLAPEQNDLRFALAKSCVDAKQTEKAREALEAILKRDPHFPGAAELLERITPTTAH